MNDFRYALRSLFAKPGFLVTVVATLALGLGVNAAIFGLFHQVLLKPLPVPEATRLVNLSGPGPKSGWTSSNDAGGTDAIFSYPMFRDLEQAQGEAITLAGHRSDNMNLRIDGNTRNVMGALVSGSYFEVLRLTPALGRLLTAQDDAQPGHAEAVVISHAYWQSQLGARADVVGSTVHINGLPMTVVGVAPPGFAGTTLQSPVEVFVPISVRWPDRPESLPEHERRDAYWVYLFGRLAPGVSAEVARERLQARYASVLNEVEAPAQEGMSDKAMVEFRAKQLLFLPGAQGQSSLPERLTTPLTTLLLVSGLVLLIACVNIANLQLARGASRANEMAVRSAIGASSARLRRQLLSESMLLAVLGAILALPMAWIVSLLLRRFDTTGLAEVMDSGISLTTVGFTFAAALTTMLLFGLFPAWQLSRGTPAESLRARGGQPGGSRASGRFRNGLAVAQVAISLTLLVLAGLFARSLDNLSQVDLGMRSDNVLSFAVVPSLNGYSPQRSQQVFARMEEELVAVPGVESLALSGLSLVADNNWGSSVSVEGYEAAPDERMNTSRNDVSPAFFRTLGIPLLAGREFSLADDADAPGVAIVNQAFVERFNLGTQAVGKRVAMQGGNPELDIEIVGVVADSTYSRVRDDTPPVLYRPLRQNPNIGWTYVYARSPTATTTLGAAMTSAMNRIDSELPVLAMRSLDEQVRSNTGMERLISVLSTGFALLATVLAAVGLYGLLAYAVSQRTREMGLRLALGSPAAQVRGLILKQVGWLALVGVVIGLLLAMALGSAASSLLYGLAGYDPLVLVAATGLLLTVVLAAAWWPAWRASRTDPMVALRDE